MKNFLNALLYLFLGLVFVVGGAYISNKLNRDDKPTAPNNQQTIVRPLVECPLDFPAFVSTVNNGTNIVKLIPQRKAMSARNGKFINPQVIVTKNETNESKVACGYLFVRAGTETNGPLQDWENIYVNPNNFGGHVDSKEQFGPGDGRYFSEYLFSLSKIHYWKTRAERARGNVSDVDWAALFNVSNEVEFEIALNTNDRTGFIDELSIAYKCWNPQTGEENKGCKLNIKSSKDIETPNQVK